MSLLTELEKLNGLVSYKYSAPSGAGDVPSLLSPGICKTEVHNLGDKLPQGRVRRWLSTETQLLCPDSTRRPKDPD